MKRSHSREKRKNRKRMDELNGYDSRDAMWVSIRQKKQFTIRDIHMETTLEVTTVRDYVRGLTNGGFLEEDGLLSSGAVFYKLIKDVGIDAPRVRKDGSLVTQGQGRLNMWQTMVVLKTFSVKDLAITASTSTCTVKETTANDYIKHLCRAGYLRRHKGGRYVFLPHKHTGPKPPMIQRVKRVWDQNLKKVMWSEDGGKQ